MRPGRRRQRLILVTKTIIQLVFKKRKKTVALTYNPGPGIKSPLLSQLSYEGKWECKAKTLLQNVLSFLTTLPVYELEQSCILYVPKAILNIRADSLVVKISRCGRSKSGSHPCKGKIFNLSGSI